MPWDLTGTPEPVLKASTLKADLPTAPGPIPGVKAEEVKPKEDAGGEAKPE